MVSAQEEVGTYTQITIYGSTYDFHYAVERDESGNITSEVINNGNYTSINGIQVYCVEPYVNTLSGSKYEAESMNEDVYATCLTLFGNQYGDDTTYLTRTSLLTTATTQALLWEHLGYTNIWDGFFITNRPNYGETRTTSYYTEEEQAIVDALKVRVAAAYTAYTSGTTAGLTLINSTNATFSNNELTIKKSDLPATLVFSGDATMLSYYENGTITVPDGVTVDVDSDAGTLTLTLSSNLTVGDYSILMSMIPAYKTGATTKYVSNYGKQTLVDYRIANPNTETLTIHVIDTPTPSTPPSPENSTPPSPENSTPPSPENSTPPLEQNSTPSSTSSSSLNKQSTKKKKSKTSLPSTGDSSGLEVVIIGLIIAVLGVTGLVFHKAKKTKK
ncbi:LPXTG cell wall anchor domain-containing protein [Streptococcus gallolyticus]|nr:LPXTG cell wall anchor domain-containing protein [Streptococcus gallolyticus]